MDRRGEIQDLYHMRGQIRRTRALSVLIFGVPGESWETEKRRIRIFPFSKEPKWSLQRKQEGPVLERRI